MENKEELQQFRKKIELLRKKYLGSAKSPKPLITEAFQKDLPDRKDLKKNEKNSEISVGKIKSEPNEKIFLETTEPFPVKDQVAPKSKRILYSHYKELDERISSTKKLADFNKRIGLCNNNPKNDPISIGISRYNCFELEKIIEFATKLKGKEIDLKDISFKLFPVNRLERNFIEYLTKLKSIAGDNNLNLFLEDTELPELLANLQKADLPERDAARLFSILAENVFLGPQTIVLDPFHRCNTNCLHCWVHTPKIIHPESFLDQKLDYELFTRMIDDFVELKVDGIIFQGDGEPLLNPKFLDMVIYARERGIQVSFFTNGLLLDEKFASTLLQLNLSEIFCSLPAGTEKTYGKINSKQRPSAFWTVVKNMKRLMVLKKKMGLNFPRLQMTHVIHTLNYHEVLEMAKIDNEIGTDCSRFYLIRLDKNVNFLKLKPEQFEFLRTEIEKVKEFLTTTKITLMDNINFQLKNYEENTGSWSKDFFLKNGCTIGWYFCLIPAKTDLSICCHLRTVDFVNKKGFKNIWLSDKYRTIRRQAKYLKENQDVTFLNGVKLYDEHCHHCDNHQRLIKTHDELKKFNLLKFYK